MRAAIDAGARASASQAIGVWLLWSTVNPGARAARRRADRRARARRPVHALAPAQPDRARVPARVVDRDRRLAEAADAGLPDRARARPARGRVPRAAVRRRPRSAAPGARRGRRAADLLASAPGPSMAPVAALTYGDAGARDGDGPPDMLVCDTGGTTFDVGLVSGGAIHYTSRDLARRPLDRPHHRHARGRRQEHRRRRRLDRLDRLRRADPRRPAERGRRPGPGLLRPRRRPSRP